jgi:hypothetical protein
MIPMSGFLVIAALTLGVWGVKKTAHGVEHVGKKIACVATLGHTCPPHAKYRKVKIDPGPGSR